MNTSTICEWDQSVILDPPDIEEGKKIKYIGKKIKYSNNFYYVGRQKYSEYNPLEALYEEDDEDDDYIRKPKREKNNVDLKIDNYIFWGDILAKSVFTSYLVYVFFIV